MLDPETFARKAADVLGLYPGPAVMEVPRLKEENPSITQARLRELYYPVEDPPEDKDAVDACFSRLAADYLPSFSQLLTSLVKISDTKSVDNLVILFQWLFHLGVYASPSLSRFVRDTPDEAVQLFHAMARWLGDVGPGYVSTNGSAAKDLCQLIVMPLEMLLTHLIANSASQTSTTQLPLLNTATTTRGLRSVVQTLSLEREVPLPELRGFVSACLVSSGVKGMTYDLRGPRARILEAGPIWDYWMCETTKQGRMVAGATCRRLPEDVELSVCGQCLAVRYCSRAHQKADWKRHKQFCFKPSW